MRLERAVRPWAATDDSQTLDSLVMERRDRLINLAVFGAAALVWLLVGLIVTTRDPIADPVAGFVGAALIGLAGLHASVEIFRGAPGLLAGRPASNHELDDRTAVRWLMAQRHPGDAVMTTHFGLPALWWYGDIPIGAPIGGGSRVPDGGAVFELSYRGRPCEPEQFRDALKDHRRLLVYLGFRFDDVPAGFDELLWLRLQELGSVPVYREFAERSRVIILGNGIISRI